MQTTRHRGLVTESCYTFIETKGNVWQPHNKQSIDNYQCITCCKVANRISVQMRMIPTSKGYFEYMFVHTIYAVLNIMYTILLKEISNNLSSYNIWCLSADVTTDYVTSFEKTWLFKLHHLPFNWIQIVWDDQQLTRIWWKYLVKLQ